MYIHIVFNLLVSSTGKISRGHVNKGILQRKRSQTESLRTKDSLFEEPKKRKTVNMDWSKKKG